MRMEKPPVHGTPAGAGAGAGGDCKPLTTFVHTNTVAFREVVQRLTGPSETKDGGDQATATATATKAVKRSKLHERRKCMKPKLEIVKPTFHYKAGAGASSPSTSKSRNSSSYPPSPVSGTGSGTSSVLPSPTTPSTLFSQLTLFEDEKKQESINIQEEEEKAIKERRFYLHPSPRDNKTGYNEPELLNLFPLASPKAT